MRSVDVLTMILAGGVGRRLYPLTANRCKPAVPFGGNFRLIDFTLMNCVLSGFRQIHLLTQYHAQSLNGHRVERWNFLSSELGEFIHLLPPKLEGSSGMYSGTADAIYRNRDLIDGARADVVLVLSGDHVYRADYRRFVDLHIERDADVTVLTSEIAKEEASDFGVVDLSSRGRITGFVEKPADPSRYAIDGSCSINLGVYAFDARLLSEALMEDAVREDSSHDFGKDILPRLVDRAYVSSCPLDVVTPDPKPYWRDVGSIDSYFQASMDLLKRPSQFELRDPRWVENSRFHEWMPSRQTSVAALGGQSVIGVNSIGHGVQLDNAQIVDCVLSNRSAVDSGVELQECVLFPGAHVGQGARLRRVIVEEGVHVPAETCIGFNDSPAPGACVVSPRGVVVLADTTPAPARIAPQRQEAIAHDFDAVGDSVAAARAPELVV